MKHDEKILNQLRDLQSRISEIEADCEFMTRTRAKF